MEEIKWYLGFKVKHDRTAHTISINQRAYIETIASKFKVITAKPVATPMDPGAMLSNDQGPVSARQTLRMRHVPYAEAIGSMLCAAIISRPDIAFAVGTLAQFIQNPGEVHWDALK